MAGKSKKKHHKMAKSPPDEATSSASSAPAVGSAVAEGAESPGTASRAPAKMKEKEYQHELRTLHGELVAMQEWVKASGAKVCVVFEGRDTAGKGGTIKAITERVSPRVFRGVALPAAPASNA